jgi:hypothetical protein
MTLWSAHKRYRKTIGECKDIESDFYVNDSSNDDLKSEI